MTPPSLARHPVRLQEDTSQLPLQLGVAMCVRSVRRVGVGVTGATSGLCPCTEEAGPLLPLCPSLWAGIFRGEAPPWTVSTTTTPRGDGATVWKEADP